ncbi:MAG: hypothetical protein J5J06_13315, partial [Phycisphaerae bacterium]|nr:hypothetical protein [Phycisphaerae bacterium]
MYSNRVCGLVFAIGLVSISSPVFGTGAGTMELRPVGVVGGNPPGTVISGNEITLTTTGVQVEFEIFVTWENILGTAQAKLDATTGYSSGAGTPLSAVGFPATPAHG